MICVACNQRSDSYPNNHKCDPKREAIKEKIRKGYIYPNYSPTEARRLEDGFLMLALGGDQSYRD
jgi:hypothetical protein